MNARSLFPVLGLVGLVVLGGCSGDDAEASAAASPGASPQNGASRSGDESGTSTGKGSGMGSSGTDEGGGIAAGPGTGTSPPAAGGEADPGPGASPGSPAVPGTTPPGEPTQPPAQSELTAGDWDDNANFALFDGYQGKFADQGALFDCRDRVLVQISSPGGRPVGGASLVVKSDGATVASIVAGTDGRAIVCPARDGVTGALSVAVTSPAGDIEASAPSDLQGAPWSLIVAGETPQTDKLDLSFVIDATGSMGDEITYLQKAITGIASDVATRFPAVDTRYSLIVYRDIGDSYVTRSFPFRDLATFSARLGEQQAGGGGDLPEAMDAGLADMNQLQWREGHVARLSFLVADAPPQPKDQQKTIGLAHAARTAGIRIYPVAASGVDDTAERVMRIAGQLTLGRYIFLTNDSGIGGDHAEPHIPCYEVSTLGRVVRRAVASEVLGSRALPEDGEIIRKVGNPEEGACTLKDGTKAFL